MKKAYQERQKYFYARPEVFPEWPYRSRNTIGVNLKDFWHMKGKFRVKVKYRLYEIDAEKAVELAKKYTVSSGMMPNLIPVDEFNLIEDKTPDIVMPPARETKPIVEKDNNQTLF